MATIITKNSSTASAVPAAGSLTKGELAVNVTDKKLYTKDNSGNVVKVVGSLGNQEANAVAITGGNVSGVTQTSSTINSTVIGNSSPQAITGTTVTASTGFVGNVTGNVTGNLTGNVTGDVTGNLTGNVIGNVTASSGTTTLNNLTINGTLDMNSGSAGTVTGLSTPVNATDAATKGYVDTSISNLIDTAPATLDTLNELAAALGDDPNFATTVTNEIATKLPLAGGTMTGAIAMGTNKITGLGTPSASTDAATKGYVDTADALNLRLTGGTMSGALAMGTNKITGLGTPTANEDATTKAYVDGILGSATSAAASAAAAAVSETNAANSASAALTSANNAAASYDSFDDRYLGPKASDPTVDNDGNALLTGALYWNTASNLMKVWNGSAWEASYLPASGYLPVSGGTMTGDITFSGTQTFDATKLSGAVPVANGGTGQTTKTEAFDALAPTTTKGDLIVSNGTDNVRLAVGTNDYVLTADSTAATGVKWAASAASPEIKIPTNVSPAGGATNIGETPALTGSTYYSLYGVAMAAGQWQVSTSSDFSSTVVNTGDVAGTSVTYNVSAGVLSTNTTYYWRVRYKDSNGVYSSWSTGTSFTTATEFGPTTIGQSYGGGYYAGKIVQGGTTYYLIVAPKSSGENSSKQWKTSNDAGPTATQTLNNGPAASSSMNSSAYPAAQFCEGLSIGGYTDWYLPARDELELCYRNLKPTTDANNTSTRDKSSYTYPEGNDVSGDTMGINRNSSPTGAAYTSGSPAQTSVTAFKSGGSEAFATDYYWSSSEYSSTNAWGQLFGNGRQSFTSLKGDSFYVRAVRRVAV